MCICKAESFCCKQKVTQHGESTILQFKKPSRRPSRWWKSKTWRSPSSPQIHQNYIYMWNNSYRTPTERWQKNSDLPKARNSPCTWVGQKKKEKTETKE